MANTSNRGFRWVRSVFAGPSNEPPVLRGRLASGLTQTLKAGDPITRRSTGYFEASIGSEGSKDIIAGVVCGFAPIYNSSTGRMEAVNQFTKSGGVYGTNYDLMSFVYYIPVRGQVFEVDADDGTSIATTANWIAAVGENCDHVLSGADTDWLPLLDISSHATTYTLQWNILDYAPRVDNDLTVTRAKVLVMCNTIQDAGSAGAQYVTPAT